MTGMGDEQIFRGLGVIGDDNGSGRLWDQFQMDYCYSFMRGRWTDGPYQRKVLYG